MVPLLLLKGLCRARAPPNLSLQALLTPTFGTWGLGATLPPPPMITQTLHLTPAQMDHLVAHPLVPFISFTGSVQNGKRVEKTAAVAAAEATGPTVFKSVGLELGGKDAAYVREGERGVLSCLLFGGVWRLTSIFYAFSLRTLSLSTTRFIVETDSDPAYAAENIVDGGSFPPPPPISSPFSRTVFEGSPP